jgi:hypothetical protein
LQRHIASARSALARWRAWLLSTLDATTCWKANNKASTPAAPTKPGAKGASRSHSAAQRVAQGFEAGGGVIRAIVRAQRHARCRTRSASAVGDA